MLYSQLSGDNMSTIQDVISAYANKENVTPICARNDLIKKGVLLELTVQKYAEREKISESSARRFLNKFCESLNGIKVENVIVGHRLVKRHAKTSLVQKYGHVYIVLKEDFL